MKHIFKTFISGVLAVSLCINSAAFAYAADSIEALTGTDNYKAMIKAGVIASDTDLKAVAQGENAQIASVDTLGEDMLIITLDCYMPDFDLNDIKLEAYNSDWYSLKPKVQNRISISDSVISVNSDGCTVIICKINEKIVGSRLENDYGEKTVADPDAEITKADNFLSWQMDHGGWDKGVDKQAARPWDGSEAKNIGSGWTSVDGGEPLGTIDNDATYTQMRQIALAYRLTGDKKYKESVEKGLEFIFKLQYPSGGLAQVYPRRGTYSDYVTYNDDAMANTLIMLEDIEEGNYPFDTDIISESYMQKVSECIDKAVDYTVKAQIVSNGVKTAWCAQHDPVTYEPRIGRAYELATISGSESIGILKFLMHRRQQTPEIKEAIDSAIAWFDKVKLENTGYNNKAADGIYFYPQDGNTLWYRFYEIGTELPIFCDRDGIPKHNLGEIGQERREGYAWAGSWPDKLLKTYAQYGYYPNRIQAKVQNTHSKDINGKTLLKNSVTIANDVNLAEILDYSTEPVFMLGDVDGDKKITAFDSAIVLQKTLNSTYTMPIEEKGIEPVAVADVDGDKKITASDSAVILQKALNNSFNMEN